MLSYDPRLYVEIVALDPGHGPPPHPITQGGFDTSRIYKVLGVYSPSETSEAYFMLANPKREVWFISNRHCRAFGLIDSDLMSLPKREAVATSR